MNAQEHDDETPRPPTGAEDDLQATVDLIAGHLMSAAEGHQPAWRLSHALLSLSNRRGVISEAQRDKLARALILFAAVSESVLPSDIDRARIAPGLAAAFGQICFWSMSPEERKSVGCADRFDMDDTARLLRNAAHDSCLLADIRGRDVERRRDEAMAAFLFSPADGLAH